MLLVVWSPAPNCKTLTVNKSVASNETTTATTKCQKNEQLIKSHVVETETQTTTQTPATTTTTATTATPSQSHSQNPKVSPTPKIS